MEERPAPARPSGIPRLSRLPVPKPAPRTVRPAASRESLHSAEPPTSRAASRESTGSTGPPRRANPPVSTQTQGQLRPARSRPSLRHATSASRLDQAQEPVPKKPDPSRRLSGRPGALPDPIGSRRSSNMNRRTSGMYSAGGAAPVPTYAQTLPSRRASPPDVPNRDESPFDTPAKSADHRSLTERTIETLSQLPSSPALSKRPSAFFEERTPRTRSRASSGASRPGSRDGSRARVSSRPDELRATTGAYRAALPTIDSTPARALRPRASERSMRGQSTRSPSATLAQGPTSLPSPRSGELERSPSPTKQPAPAQPALSPPGLASKPLRLKPSSDLQVKKGSPQGDKPGRAPRKVSRVANKPITPTKMAPPPEPEDGVSPGMLQARKSSAALREQIAKARAVAKKNAVQQVKGDDAPRAPPVAGGFDFGFEDPHHADPFNQRRDGQSLGKVLQQRAATGRTTGRLNIAALGLREMPEEVMGMYDAEAVGGGNWAESVDLTRLVAADNEFEAIGDDVFPDVDGEALAEDEEGRGNIFGGLESADLHGNHLVSVPPGLRQLKMLTSLNLSQNRLPNASLEIISEIPGLRDLKLANNNLDGPLPPSFTGLASLEILDLHGNKISALPADLDNLTRLRVLNVGENRLEALPFETLAEMPLTELVARSNRLSGTLIGGAVSALASLQTLDVSSNQLTRIVASGRVVALPALRQLTVSLNRLQGLPDVSTWTSLATLSADENAIAEVPEGLTSLDRLRHVDLSANDVRVIPAEVGRMDGLVTLRIAGNPLRDKKFASISTDELKDVLAARLEPPPPYHVGIAQTVDTAFEGGKDGGVGQVEAQDDDGPSSDLDHYATPPTSAPASPTRSRAQTPSGEVWPVKAGGVLDRSGTDSATLHPVPCARAASEHAVAQAHLQHNLFCTLPEGLSFFAGTLTALSLAHNQLVGETYLNETLELPALREMNLSSNHVTGLGPLVGNLLAPRLEKLDVSMNRLTKLPVPSVKEAFPNLAVLLAGNNHIAELEPEAIVGLKVVDVGNNDIAHLNPRLGLLGGAGGLERLEVRGNRFRVPRFSVVDLGTEATLRWLRGRLPAGEGRRESDEE